MGTTASPFSKHALQNAVMTAVNNCVLPINIIITLTFPGKTHPINKDAVKHLLGIFANQMNQRIGNTGNHKRKRAHNPQASLPMVNMVEGGDGTKRLHVHGLVHKPMDMTTAQFRQIVLDSWKVAVWHAEAKQCKHPWQKCIWRELYERYEYPRCDVQERVAGDNGYSIYSTKEFGCGNTDALDEKSYWLPQANG